MIQINLIPDIKRDYLRARRTRDIAVSVSMIAGLASIGVVGLLLLVLGTQTGREVLADRSIDSEYEQLSSVEDLSDMVTIDNQLSLISGQHATKSMHSRMFSILEAINPADPNNVSFSDVTVNPAETVIVMEGSARGGYPAVETLAKTIENTVIESTTDQGESSDTPLASDIIIGETTYGRDADDRRVLRFEMTIKYTPDVLTNQLKSVKVKSPTKKIDATDSRQRVPDSLFSAPAKDIDGEDQ